MVLVNTFRPTISPSLLRARMIQYIMSEGKKCLVDRSVSVHLLSLPLCVGMVSVGLQSLWAGGAECANRLLSVLEPSAGIALFLPVDRRG